jgi:hypothetical protein
MLRNNRVLYAFLGAPLFFALPGCSASGDETAPTTNATPAIALATQPIQAARASLPPGSMSREDWHRAVLKGPPGRHGCFRASRPSTTWAEVPCSKKRPRHFGTHGPIQPLPENVGASTPTDSGQSSSPISAAQGFFTGVSTTGESDSNDGNNAFSVQLNSNKFSTPLCSAPCLGWQQFIFIQDGNGIFDSGIVYIQYWMLNYLPSHNGCPPYWNQSGNHCWYVDSDQTPSVSTQDITELGAVRLVGTAGPASDTATFFDSDGDSATASEGSSVLGLGSAGRWTAAGFNIYGEGSGSQASFDAGTSMFVNLVLTTGSKPISPA